MSKIHHLAVATAGLLISGAAFAHGYISNPPSRALLCQAGQNTQCGPIQYEPQSVEGPDGFPQSGPVDGQLASAGALSLASQLDIQTSDHWVKTPIRAGLNTFSWHLTAIHRSASYRYYITKADWNPNQPLSRASFELTPFCVIDAGNQIPESKNVSHSCHVPERNGYQIIYGTWDVADTAATFYNVLDVQFESGQPSEWSVQIGQLSPNRDLKAGDEVKTRLFSRQGELPALSTSLVIESAEQGQRTQWAHALAGKINASSSDLRAGVKGQDGVITPVYGLNTFYTHKDSHIERVEIEVKEKVEQPKIFEARGVNDSYTLNDGSTRIDFSVMTFDNVVMNAYIYNSNNTPVQFVAETVEKRTHQFSMPLQNAAAGQYSLVLISAPNQDGISQQETFTFTLTGGAQEDVAFTFPQGLGQYKEGMRVLQPKDGAVYQCKPFPYSGWCNIWSASASQYEPGTGSHWQDAWIKVGHTH